MTIKTLIACTLGLSAALSNSALASSYLELGVSKKSSTITTIGKAPDKEKKNLKLGVLRTREARLPNGVLSLEDRMRLRAKRAVSRQKAVTEARRPDDADKGAIEGDPVSSSGSGGDIVME
jgi:hypothetical protein